MASMPCGGGWQEWTRQLAGLQLPASMRGQKAIQPLLSYRRSLPKPPPAQRTLSRMDCESKAAEALLAALRGGGPSAGGGVRSPVMNRSALCTIWLAAGSTTPL